MENSDVDEAVVDSTSTLAPPRFANAAFDIVAIAASAGGLKALIVLLSGLPVDFPAAIVVVQHLDPKHRSLMANILSRYTPLSVKEAQAGENLEPGAIYIAPPIAIFWLTRRAVSL